MPSRGKRAADAAQPTDATSAAAQAASEAIVPNDNTPLADAASIAPTADGTVDVPAAVVPAAVAAARQTAAQIAAALESLPTDNPAVAALQAALADANGAVALAEAEAALQAAKASQIEAAQAAATAANLPEAVLSAMLAAIEAQYAPAPAPEAEVAPAPQMPTFGRKQPSPRTLAFNAAAVAAAAADATVAARAIASVKAFDSEWSGDLHGVARVAGTRFASIVALAGDGVTGEADYKSLVAQVRHYLLSLGLAAGGASSASLPWLLAAGPHAAGGDKGADSLPLKFLSGAMLALHSDGRFRLTLPSTPNVRYLSRDAAALAAFRSGNGATAAAAPSAPQNVPSAPHVPTPPTAAQVAAAAAGAAPSKLARCQHCSTRNIVGAAECSACGEADWQVA